MSQFVPPKPRLITVRRGFVLVASQFNAKYVQGMVTQCTDELRTLSPASNVALHLVPGAFEIPLAVREVALKKEADAIIALGVILEGETDHAHLLAESVTNALQQISLKYGVPVIHAVLSLKDEAQAGARCLGGNTNRGKEAAHAAHEMANLMAGLRK